MLAGAIAGYLVLRDYEGDSGWSMALYWVSILVINLGLYMLVWWPSRWLGDGDMVVPWLACCLRPPPNARGGQGPLGIQPGLGLKNACEAALALEARGLRPAGFGTPGCMHSAPPNEKTPLRRSGASTC